MQGHNSLNPAASQATASVVVPTIASFEFHNQPVRIVMADGVAMFLVKDLAPILGYSHAREAARTRVDKRDRGTVRNPDATCSGGNPFVLAVNESGLFALVLGSTKPEAQAFRYWVTSEVLPTLRKTGRYEMKAKVPALLEQISTMLQGRGAAKNRQLNKIVAHRDHSFSFRIGKRWARHVSMLDVSSLPRSHSLREGIALSALMAGKSTTALMQ
jgi:prophage antirepressor-like protein